MRRSVHVPLLAAIADGTFGLMKRPADAGRGLDGVAETAPGYCNPARELLDAPEEPADPAPAPEEPAEPEEPAAPAPEEPAEDGHTVPDTVETGNGSASGSMRPTSASITSGTTRGPSSGANQDAWSWR